MENICTVLITLFGEYIEREKKGPMLLHINGTKTSLKKKNNKKRRRATQRLCWQVKKKFTLVIKIS